jgi:Domain of Unknown Function (DUF1080)
MLKRTLIISFLTGFYLCLTTASTLSAGNPFLGDWALTIPGGAAGWLGVDQSGDQIGASMLWGWGSVFPLDSAKTDGDKLVLTRNYTFERNAAGKKEKVNATETYTCSVSGDSIRIVSVKPKESGQGEDRAEFSGKRQPPMPSAPDLKKAKFGKPVQLFNGKDLSGWRLTDPNAVNGWSVKDGLLVNSAVQEEGKPHKNYGNLRTDKEFEDFNLKVQVRVGKDQNSGVYLRGIYEVQVADTYGHKVDPHNMGGVYSRVCPTAAAEKPPGEWQTMDITLLNRHVTVILNGKKIIDNQPVRGCTGGALWSDVMKPGPIYLQGDHTGIEYKSLELRPALK